jgi:uncharacterized membrane protein
MTMVLLVAVHWLHVLAGMVWFGGQVFINLVLWPMLLRRPAGEARELVQGMGRWAGPLMGGSGMAVLLLGILRGTWLGPVRSPGALFSTPYGLTFLAALLLTVFVMGHAGRARERVMERVWDGDAYRPGAAEHLRRSGAVTLVGLTGIVLCMVLMRFGL